jgi:methylthioribose-1-phosphate isomerase
LTNLIPLEWQGSKLRLLDQTLLPREEVYLEITDYRQVVSAIQRLAVRGAPAIGIAAAYGVVLGALSVQTCDKEVLAKELQTVFAALASSRPTARNLFWALEQMQQVKEKGKEAEEIKQNMVAQALKIHAEQMASDLTLSRSGASLIQAGDTILTHCNAGALATGGYGTALGVIKQAHADGKKIRAVATETRPLLQGARLTACELIAAGVPFTLITDSMGGAFMRQGKVQAVVVGADCIATNGDTANKIGTYTLAVVAKEHQIPFYIAAPTSTIDTSITSGDEIIIEERPQEEVTSFHGELTVPEGTLAANPAFDVTPHRYISAIITEKGIIRAPFEEGIRNICQEEKALFSHQKQK